MTYANICRWSTSVIFLFLPPGFSFPSYKFPGRPNALWVTSSRPIHYCQYLEYLCRLEVVYFLLSHLFISLSLWSEVLGQDPRLNFLKSMGKLSPLNDMLHYFVVLRGKMCWENGDCLLFLLTLWFQNLLKGVNKDEVRSPESLD